MILLLKEFLGDSLPAVTGYLTFRAAMALLLSFIVCLLTGPSVIRALRRLKIGQQVRDDQGAGALSLLAMHPDKQGVPTAGGVMIAVAMLLPVLLLADPRNPIVWMLLFVMISCAAIGFADDYLKITRKNSKGLPGRYKLLGQGIVGLVFGAYLALEPHVVSYAVSSDGARVVLTGTTFLSAPFFKQFYVNLGWFYVPFVAFVLMAMSNAVNLTDGLDGLASGISIIVALAFAIIAYAVSRHDFANYLLLPHVAGAGEAVVFLTALAGAGMGFLWFNAHPAQIFMGDTGSLMLGGVLGSVAVLTKSELLLVIIGGVFVAEAASVVLQVGSYKLRRRRVFLMAPIHHHFERLGWAEPQIITRFYIVASLLALFGLSTLKMR